MPILTTGPAQVAAATIRQRFADFAQIFLLKRRVGTFLIVDPPRHDGGPVQVECAGRVVASVHVNDRDVGRHLSNTDCPAHFLLRSTGEASSGQTAELETTRRLLTRQGGGRNMTTGRRGGGGGKIKHIGGFVN